MLALFILTLVVLLFFCAILSINVQQLRLYLTKNALFLQFLSAQIFIALVYHVYWNIDECWVYIVVLFKDFFAFLLICWAHFSVSFFIEFFYSLTLLVFYILIEFFYFLTLLVFYILELADHILCSYWPVFRGVFLVIVFLVIVWVFFWVWEKLESYSKLLPHFVVIILLCFLLHSFFC